MNIGIVSSRPDAADLLRRAVLLTDDHRVVWTAATAADAIGRCVREPPTLVLVDLGGDLDGIDVTRQITQRSACAVMIVIDSVEASATRVFEALSYGAIDGVDLPRHADGIGGAATLLAKLSTLARLIGEPAARQPAGNSPAAVGPTPCALVAVGASAGGPAAVAALLRGLPQNFPGAVVIVQHVDAQFALGMAGWLGDHTPLPVRVAVDGDRVIAGEVLLAGGRDHLVLTSPVQLGFRREPEHALYRPSIDAFFDSVIRHWQGEAVGILLTGMGRDGAAGLKAMRTRGFYTIAQDEASSAVFGMPRAAVALDAAVDVLPIDEVASRVVVAIGQTTGASMHG